MAHHWHENHEAPEVAPQDSLPEVVYHVPTEPAVSYNRANLAPASLSSFNSPNGTPTSAIALKERYSGTTSFPGHEDQYSMSALPPAERPVKPQRRFCGCSLLVLVLSTIIALLSAAVIGLAVATGIQTNKVHDANATLASYPAEIDAGCAANPDSVTASLYTSDFYDRSTYKIFCNTDAQGDPLQSLFVATFNDCMDACASYSWYMRSDFPDHPITKNSTCAAATFVTDWTNRTTALGVNAPGNCYLKPGPQNSTTLTHPNPDGPAVHVALLVTS